MQLRAIPAAVAQAGLCYVHVARMAGNRRKGAGTANCQAAQANTKVPHAVSRAAFLPAEA